jgi:hypothetical protein
MNEYDMIMHPHRGKKGVPADRYSKTNNVKYIRAMTMNTLSQTHETGSWVYAYSSPVQYANMRWDGGPTIEMIDISDTGDPDAHADICPVLWLVGRFRE